MFDAVWIAWAIDVSSQEASVDAASTISCWLLVQTTAPQSTILQPTQKDCSPKNH